MMMQPVSSPAAVRRLSDFAWVIYLAVAAKSKSKDGRYKNRCVDTSAASPKAAPSRMS